jgi:hypothetical protein
MNTDRGDLINLKPDSVIMWDLPRSDKITYLNQQPAIFKKMT